MTDPADTSCAEADRGPREGRERVECIVETREGKLRGTERDGVAVYRGIPFAKPPVGALRFCAPEPPGPWSGTRDATGFGPAAPQNPLLLSMFPGIGIERQDEDCLYLNVYAPAAPGGGRPVLVWLHGGAFVIGAGSQPIYDGRALARRGDAVVVTVNYRLGVLGFLDPAGLPGLESGATANAGILDQVAALGWVREHASAFGGDPGNVTIFGESAGAMSVGTLLGVPEARGLFRRAILQSGACQAIHSRESAGRVAQLLREELGIGAADAAKLRELPVERLLEAQPRVMAKHLSAPALLAFQPVVDGEILPRHPLQAVREGAADGASILVGTTRDEWKLFAFLDPKVRRLDEEGLVARIEKRLPGEDARGIVAAYREARAGRAPTDPPALWTAFETDRNFRIPAIRLAEASAGRGVEAFAYLFCWEAPFLGGLLGACHAIDLPFVFGALGLDGMDKLVGAGPEAERLAEATMDAWLAFARAGRPAHPGLAAWPAYEPEGRATMRLGRECGLERDPQAAERRVWESLG